MSLNFLSQISWQFQSTDLIQSAICASLLYVAVIILTFISKEIPYHLKLSSVFFIPSFADTGIRSIPRAFLIFLLLTT
jgi:hypothetical protein